MSDVTRLADARWRYRCAVQAMDAAVHELRVAEARLAEAQGRDPARICFSLLGVRRGALGVLAGGAAASAPSAPCPDLSDPARVMSLKIAARDADAGPAAVPPEPSVGPDRVGGA